MTALVALCLGASQAMLVAIAVRGARLSTILLLHASVCAVAALVLRLPHRRVGRYDALLWLSTAAFGPFGPGGVLLMMALERGYSRSVTAVEEWHATLFPSGSVDPNAELWRRIGQRASDRPAAQQVTPFLDILSFGSVPQRQAVIAIIAQQFDPAFAPALRAALRDEHNVVRVQAATAIARLENQFLERTFSLEAAVREAPDDARAVLALASHYDDQAFAGLLDPTREQECRVKAADGYQRYLRQCPDDDAAEFRLARLQLRRRKSVEATPRFRRLVARGNASARIWLMESLFADARYDELRAVALATTSEEAAGCSPEVASAVELWSSPGGAA